MMSTNEDLLPEVGADVLLQHAAESWPQVMQSPVKRVDAMTQSMAAKRAHLQGGNSIVFKFSSFCFQMKFDCHEIIKTQSAN